MARSVFAVIVGNIVWTLLRLGFNAILANFYPEISNSQTKIENAALLLSLLGYSVFISIVAGYVTATIARQSEIRHAVALGLLQLALGIFFQAQSWTLLPLWYHLLFLALLIPGNVLGGWLHLTQKRSTVQTAH